MFSIFAAALLCVGCASEPEQKSPAPPPAAVQKHADPYASTYVAPPAPVTAIVNATILSAAGPRIERGTLVIADGQVRSIGAQVEVPADAKVIDAAGRWVTPGLIDFHSHAGLGFDRMRIDEGNELSDSNVAQIRIEHSIWPQSPVFPRLLRGGVTTLHVLPGSGPMFAGRTVVLKNVPSVDIAGMKFPGAPDGLKIACGENPIASFGGKGRPPMTRAGEIAGYRTAFLAASNYAKRWDGYRKTVAEGGKSEPPPRDFALETLAGVLKGEVKAHIHCYRAADMSNLMAVAREFQFKIAAFHHATEAFKMSRRLADQNIPVAMWSGDYAGYKLEAMDSILENAAFLEQAGGTPIIHSDDENIGQQLNIEAARAMFAGRRAGFEIPYETAIRWLTMNPARVLGIAERTGSLEVGKAADVVVWSGDPFSTYALAEQVFIDGVLRFDRALPDAWPQSDFEIGQPTLGGRL
jgi:imidazolonepropionase-like amidohydrolase